MRQGDHPNWLVSPLCECSLLFSASRMFTAMIYHTHRRTDRQTDEHDFLLQAQDGLYVSRLQHYLALLSIREVQPNTHIHMHTHTRRRR